MTTVTVSRPGDQTYPPAGDWITVNAKARELGVQNRWVSSRLARRGARSELRVGYKGLVLEHYDPSDFADMELELEYIRSLPLADGYITSSALVPLVGCRRSKIEKAFAEMGIPPSWRRDSHDRVVVCYPPIVDDLMAYIFRLPKNDDVEMATAWEIARATGWNLTTVVRRLRKAGIRSVRRVSIVSGRRVKHYPRQRAIKILGHKPRDVPAAGDWVTLTRAFPDRATRKRAKGWMEEKGYDAAAAKDRLTDTQRIARHYPPWAIDQARRAIEIDGLDKDQAA